MTCLFSRLQWVRDLSGHLIYMDSSLVGFGLGPLLVEGKEMKCFLWRKGDLYQTLLRVAILDGLCRAGANSSGNQQGFTEKGSPPSWQQELIPAQEWGVCVSMLQLHVIVFEICISETVMWIKGHLRNKMGLILPKTGFSGWGSERWRFLRSRDFTTSRNWPWDFYCGAKFGQKLSPV